MQLRPYQLKAATDIQTTFAAGCKSALFVCFTGAGKTQIFTYLTGMSAAKGRKVLILVHRIELLSQASERLTENNIRHGIINSKYKPALHYYVQIATVGSFVKKLDCFEPDFIIIDEAHHTPAGQFKTILEHLSNRTRPVYTLGVSATPARLDGKPLKGCFTEMVLGPMPSELIDMGYIMEPELYCPKTSLDLTNVTISDGEYNKTELKKAIGKSRIIGDAIELYNKICPCKSAIAFCTTIKHAKETAELFRQAGYSAECLDGSITSAVRKDLIKKLGTGELQILTSCDIISEGTDIPRVEVAILLRPTASLTLFIQQVGRVLRKYEGKTKAIVLDLAGNIGQWINGVFFENHGKPTEDREWSLENGAIKKKRDISKEPPMRVCGGCFRRVDQVPICPHCGFEVQKSGNELRQIEGELKKLEDQAQVIKKKDERIEQGKAQSIIALFELAKHRSYSKGWVYNVFLSKVKKAVEQIEKKNIPESEKIKLISIKFDINIIGLQHQDIENAVKQNYIKWKNRY